MAYKDKEKKEVDREYRRRQRQGSTKGVTEDGETLELVEPAALNVEPDVTPSGEYVNPDVIPSSPQSAGWPHVIEFIKRTPRPGDIPNLLKLQRVAGSLSHVSKDAKDTPVWFGSLTMRNIGETLGTTEHNMPPSGPPVRV